MRTLVAAVAAFMLLVLAPSAMAAPPTPGFTVDPDPPTAGVAAEFLDASIDPDGDPIAKVEWDFDNDGTPEEIQDPATDPPTPVTHLYTTPGVHTLRMVVTDDTLGLPDESKEEFFEVVVNAAPTADFVWNPNSPVAGEEVFFASTSDDDGPVSSLTYEWDVFGIGTSIDGNTQTFTTPLPAGNHTVQLTVRDTQGGVGTFSDTVTVGPTPPPPANQLPVAQFSISPLQPLIDQLVTFESYSYDPDGPAPALAWDLDGDGFDDGSGTTASTTFTTSGPKSVSLQATDSNGGFNMATKNFEIAPAASAPTPTPPTVPAGTPAAPSLLSPWPVIRLAGTLRPRGTRVGALEVRAPRAATVTARCLGKRCPFRRQQRTAGTRLVRFPDLRTFLPAGTVITIAVTKDSFIGRHTRFLIRADRGPKRTDSCLFPGRNKPAPCPES